MIENELVDVIIDSGATCNLISEQVFDKVSQGKLELLKMTQEGLCLCISGAFKAWWKMHVEHLCT